MTSYLEAFHELVAAATPLALAWAWQASLVAAAALAVTAALRRSHPTLRHAVLLLALVEFALPPILPAPWAMPRFLTGPVEYGSVEITILSAAGERPAPLPMVLAALYLAGVCLALARVGRRIVLLHRLRVAAHPLPAGPLRDTTQLEAARLGLSRTPRLLVSAETEIPFLTSCAACRRFSSAPHSRPQARHPCCKQTQWQPRAPTRSSLRM